ncbi:hypothetical protein HDU96_008489, partial [Phlyctochytrium bullatum]
MDGRIQKPRRQQRPSAPSSFHERQERDPLLPRAAPTADEAEAGFVGRAIRATNNLSRKALIFTVLVSTFVGTPSSWCLVSMVSPRSPPPLYAVLDREIGALQKEFGIKGLAHEGLLSCKEPIRKYLPDFELKERVATEQATLIDLLFPPHCEFVGLDQQLPSSYLTKRFPQGLPRHEYMWVYEAEDLLTRLKHLEPTFQFREGFQYNNLMYSVAGYRARKVHGKGWHDLITEKILKPLGMTRSFARYPDARNQSNIAQGFAAVFEGGYPLEMNVSDPILNIASAGSISSTVKD